MLPNNPPSKKRENNEVRSISKYQSPDASIEILDYPQMYITNTASRKNKLCVSPIEYSFFAHKNNLPTHQLELRLAAGKRVNIFPTFVDQYWGGACKLSQKKDKEGCCSYTKINYPCNTFTASSKQNATCLLEITTQQPIIKKIQPGESIILGGQVEPVCCSSILKEMSEMGGSFRNFTTRSLLSHRAINRVFTNNFNTEAWIVLYSQRSEEHLRTYVIKQFEQPFRTDSDIAYVIFKGGISDIIASTEMTHFRSGEGSIDTLQIKNSDMEITYDCMALVDEDLIKDGRQQNTSTCRIF